MSKHVSISPEEGADDVAVRELIDAYADVHERQLSDAGVGQLRRKRNSDRLGTLRLLRLVKIAQDAGLLAGKPGFQHTSLTSGRC